MIFAAVADEEAGSRKGALFLVEQHPELVRAEYVLNEVGGHTLHLGKQRFYPIQVARRGSAGSRSSPRASPATARCRIRTTPWCGSRARSPRSAASRFRSTTPRSSRVSCERWLRARRFPQNRLLPLVAQSRAGRHAARRAREDQPGSSDWHERHAAKHRFADHARRRQEGERDPFEGERAGRRARDPRSDACETSWRDRARDRARAAHQRARAARRHHVRRRDRRCIDAICGTLARHDPGASRCRT